MKINIIKNILYSFKETPVNGLDSFFFLGNPVSSLTGYNIDIHALSLKCESLHSLARELIMKTCGDCLYIAQRNSEIAIIRPIFSEITAFYQKEKNSVNIWNTPKIPASIEINLNYNFNYLRHFLGNMSVTSHETGFNQINEVISGTFVIISKDKTSIHNLSCELYLSAKVKDNLDFDEKTSEIKKQIMNSIQHKTANCSSISFLSSGGLDSSIALIAAHQLDYIKEKKLINFFSETDRDGDERFYVNLLSQKDGCSSYYYNSDKIHKINSLDYHLLGNLSRPCKMAGTIGMTYTGYKKAQDLKTNTIISGDGGDQLFFRMKRTCFIRDIVKEKKGISQKIFSLMSLAQHERKSIYEILSLYINNSDSKRLLNKITGNGSFSKSIFFKDNSYHMQISPDSHLLPVDDISRLFQFQGMRFAEHNRTEFEEVNVMERKLFLFWPLIKSSMSSMRNHHFLDGTDRALERACFSKELPTEIISRNSKGSGKDILERFDFDFLRDNLLESPVESIKQLIDINEIKKIKKQNLTYEDAVSIIKISSVCEWMKKHV